jgi:hypothetical protein
MVTETEKREILRRLPKILHGRVQFKVVAVWNDSTKDIRINGPLGASFMVRITPSNTSGVTVELLPLR